MNAYRFSSASVVLVLGLLLVGGIAAQGQVTNFADEFTSGPLDAGWNVINPANHVGYTGTGYYKMVAPTSPNNATLQRSPGATNEDFTADVTFQIDEYINAFVDYKFRFLAPSFMEVVVNPVADSIRVFSGELGMNFGSVGGLGLTTGTVVNIRLSYDADKGNVKAAYSLGSDPLTLLGAASGLSNFQVSNIDINIQRLSGGLPFVTPSILVDRFEIQDQVVGVNFDTFEDPFDGPTLDASWDIIEATAGDHVGFSGGGLYEVKKTTLSGESGLSRDFGGQADFYSTVEFQMQDFIGSDSRVEFRHPSPGSDITVILDSVGDVQVVSNGTTVTDLAGFSYQDGETLKLSVSTDSVNGLTEVGLQRNGGAWLLLASLDGAITSTNNETVVIKSGVGNGNSPRLQFDHYLLDEGFAAVPLEPFTEHFTGPALDASWFTSDSGVGSLVGFNQLGQYEISTSSNVTAGLSRFIGFAGDATFTLTARLVDFIGTDTELRFALTGADAITVVLRSDDTLEIITDEFGSVYGPAAAGVSDGDLVTLQLTINPEFGDWEFGLGINGTAPALVYNDFLYSDLNPTQTEITVIRGAGGSQPSILLDQTTVNEGFVLIPQAAETYSDDFNAGPLDGAWIVVDGGDPASHPGYTNSQWYAMQMTTNGVGINLNRLMAPSGFAGVPVGSFSANLDVRFDEMVGTNAPGGGTDFKYKIEGGNLMEIVFNSFKTVRFYTDQNGQNWFQSALTDFNDGDTVNFGVAYDATGPSVTMSVGLNGTNVFRETRSNLVGVAPEIIKLNGFRFNTSQPDLVPTFLYDQLDVNPGLAGVAPGALTFAPAYSGLYEITWDLGELQSAPTIFGAWSNVIWATSPYLTDLTETSEFFRAEN